MRVTAEAKATTRRQLLDAARQWFAGSGVETCTLRQIADAAGIATGTVFNYFATQEAVLTALAAESVVAVHRDFECGSRKDDTLEEGLFALVAAELRKLR